jgi:hypothetical protein
VNNTITKLEDSQNQRQALKMPCANGPCQEPAVHVVSGHFDYPEKVKARRTTEGFRWVTRTESFLLYFCRDHRNKWLRKGTEVNVGGGLI